MSTLIPTRNLIFMNQPLPLLCHPDAPGPALQGSPLFICISGPPFPSGKLLKAILLFAVNGVWLHTGSTLVQWVGPTEKGYVRNKPIQCNVVAVR
jgi:hypothetical protein